MHRTFAKNQKHNTMKNTNNNSDCKNSNVSGLISQAIQKQDAALLREFINTKWDKSTPVYPVTDDNIKDVVEFAIKALGDNANLNWIDTSKVTNMQGLFSHKVFIGDISRWDVSNVDDMSIMFAFSEFSGDISKWDVSNVTTMQWMFMYSKFNGDISNWNISKVTNMTCMFQGSDFNQDISSWDLSHVQYMIQMFAYTKRTNL